MITPTPGLIVEYEHSGAHFATSTADGRLPLALCKISSDVYGDPLHLVAVYTASDSRTPDVTCPKCLVLISGQKRLEGS